MDMELLSVPDSIIVEIAKGELYAAPRATAILVSACAQLWSIKAVPLNLQSIELCSAALVQLRGPGCVLVPLFQQACVPSW